MILKGSEMKVFNYTFCIFLILIVAAPLSAIEGDVELLRFIADAYETNQEKIRTWGGSVVVESSVVYAETEELIQKGRKRHSKTKFLIDKNFGATRWNTRFKEVTYNEGKEKQREAFDYSGMVKSNQGYQMFYDSEDKQALRTMELLSADNIIRTENGFTFDPAYIWEHIYPIRQQMKFYYENAHNPNFSSGHTIIRQGDIVTFESKVPSGIHGKDNVNRLVFDLSQGCNLVELVALSQVNEVRWKLDYERIGKVFVIKEISKSYKDKRPGNEHREQMKATLINKIVNNPVNPAEFKFDKIALRPGDHILDRTIGGLEYVWKETPDDVLEVLQNTGEELDTSPLQKVPSTSPVIVQNVPEIPESVVVDAENSSGDGLALKSLSFGIVCAFVVLLWVTGWFVFGKIFRKKGRI